MSKYELTPEHRWRLRPWADKWIENAMRTGPYTASEVADLPRHVEGLYAAAGLPPPQNVVIAAGPITAAFAAGISAGVWWLREHAHPEFGRLTEAEICAARDLACAVADGRDTFGATFGATRVATRDATFGATRDATSDATRDATDVATRDATDVATSDATFGATRDATSDATRDATSDATRDATDVATSDATRDATDDATDDATRDATDVATTLATSVATTLATSGATDVATTLATSVATTLATSGATDVATDDATSVATRVATTLATRAATRVATTLATRAATDVATDDATSVATDVATRDATRVATTLATRAATSDATFRATNGATSDVARWLLSCAAVSYRLRDGGNHWSGWAAYISFFRHVARLPIDYSRWQHYESLAAYGPRYVHAKFAIVSRRPARLTVDDERRPHCADGPFCVWPDGRSLYYWHGTEVPREWIEAPALVDPTLALTWPQAEQRRCLAEILGWGRVVDQLSRVTIHSDPDPEIGDLFEVELEGARERFVRARCGTGRTIVLPVPPDTLTPRAGIAWSYGLESADLYAPEVRT